MNLNLGKSKYFIAIATLSTIVTTNLVSLASAQTLPRYDRNLAPYVRGNNPPPGSRPRSRSFRDYLPPLNPTSPFGWAGKVITVPNQAGNWRETVPNDPADVDGDGFKDMSYPYYPHSWSDSNHDGYFDSSGYNSY